jgi:hypothetical protein
MHPYLKCPNCSCVFIIRTQKEPESPHGVVQVQCLCLECQSEWVETSGDSDAASAGEMKDKPIE